MRAAISRSLTARTLVLSVAVALVLSAAFALLIVSTYNQRSAARRALRSQQAITAGTELQRTAANLEAGVRGFVASRSTSALGPFTAGRRAYPGQVRRLERLVGPDPTAQRLVRDIAGELEDYVNLWALPLMQLTRERPEVARSVVVSPTGRNHIKALRADFAHLFRWARGVATSRLARAESRSKLAVWLGVGGIALVVGLTLGVALYLRRSVIRPVRAVAAASEAVAGGDLAARVPETHRDELGALARSFNTMARSLGLSRRELAHRTAELERSNRELEDYASVAAHDLQGPLSTISMFADLLQRRLREGDPANAELAANVRAASGRLTQLVRDLLTYSRVGRGEMCWEDVPLDEVVATVVSDLAGPIGERGATVRSAPLPVVTGDRQRLCQLVQNLLSNAVKFSVDDPVVRVEGAPAEPGKVAVSVRDNGIGFDPALTGELFRPFTRLPEAGDREGSGIGLALCERIVSRHGGRIWAESHPGEGSVFHFTLPLASPAGWDQRWAEATQAVRS